MGSWVQMEGEGCHLVWYAGDRCGQWREVGEGASSFSEWLAQTTKEARRLHVYREAHVRLKDAMVQGSLCGSPEPLKMVSVHTKRHRTDPSALPSVGQPMWGSTWLMGAWLPCQCSAVPPRQASSQALINWVHVIKSFPGLRMYVFNWKTFPGWLGQLHLTRLLVTVPKLKEQPHVRDA